MVLKVPKVNEKLLNLLKEQTIVKTTTVDKKNLEY